jgi:hypothetical protein
MDIERLLADVARKLAFSPQGPYGYDPYGIFGKWYGDIEQMRKSLWDFSLVLGRERKRWQRGNAKKDDLPNELPVTEGDGPCPKCGGDYWWMQTDHYETVRAGTEIEEFKEKKTWDDLLFCASCEPPADTDLVTWFEDRKPSSDGSTEEKISSPTFQESMPSRPLRSCEVCGASLEGMKRSATCCSGRCRNRKARRVARREREALPNFPDEDLGGLEIQKT